MLLPAIGRGYPAYLQAGDMTAGPYGRCAICRMSIGGAEGDRTLDLRIANAALSQLSYCPDLAGAF